MSRNLARTDCYFCHSTDFRIESPTMSWKDYAKGKYFEKPYGSDYGSMTVAIVTCSLCEAKYVGWCNDLRIDNWRRTPGGGATLIDTTPSSAEDFNDLSFRSTFNDEPGDLDLPVFRVKNGMRVGWFRDTDDPNEKHYIEVYGPEAGRQ